jgi:hypothetical protein
MKNSHLTDTQYITYFLRKHKLKQEEYDAFVSEIPNLIEDEDVIFINKTHQTLYVDLRPYMFTMFTISEKTMSYFVRFLNLYLKHASCDLCNTSHILTTIAPTKYNNLAVFFYMIKQSTLVLISVLYVMQYFFL